MNKSKITLILILMTLIITTATFSAAQVVAPTPVGATIQGGMIDRETILQEEIKTRSEIKNYISAVKNDLETRWMTEGQEFFDKNAAVWEQRAIFVVNKALIKICIGIASAIILSQLIWFLIKKKIESIRNRRDQLIRMKKEEQAKTIMNDIDAVKVSPKK